MARRPSVGPTERELDILEILWEGERRVREVHAALDQQQRTSFTAVQTMLQIMFDKGLVGRELVGRSYEYWPEVSREEAQATLLEHLLERAFGGSAAALVSRALDVKRASAAELDEIEAMIEKARRA